LWKELIYQLLIPKLTITNLLLKKKAKCSAENPDHWKESIISLIPKTGNILDPSNYRPISLLNTDYKIFSTILNQHVTHHLETNEIMSKLQFGGTKNHSTAQTIYTSLH